MRIEFSVVSDAGERDLAVTAPAATEVREFAPAVAALAGAEPGAPLWVGDRPLARARLGDGSLPPGAVVHLGRPGSAAERVAVVALHVVGGPAAGTVVPLARGRVLIGRDPVCDLVLPDPDVSRRHAEISLGPSVLLRDLGSTNRTLVDGEPLGDRPVPLHPGAVVRIGDSLLALAVPEETPASVRAGPDATRQVLRPPRAERSPGPAEVVLPVRPARDRRRGVQWLSALLPALAGVALAWLAHSPQFLLFALLSPLMMVSTSVGDRVHWRRSRRREAEIYRRRRAAADREIAAGLRAETAARRHAFPDPAAVRRIAGLPADRLWARHPGDPELLTVRLGTGCRPARLRVREATVTAPAGVLRDVPVTVDLRAGPLGLAGPAQLVDTVAPWLVGQLAVQHSPADLQLALLIGPERESAWGWTRWLPHLHGQVAAAPDRWRLLIGELAELVERRLAARRGDRTPWPGPWTVLVADRAAEFAAVEGFRTILREGGTVGVTAVCLETDPARLPAGCRAVARPSGETGTRLLLCRGPAEPEIEAVADQVGDGWGERLARDLAPLVDPGGQRGGTLPRDCGLLEPLGLREVCAQAVAARWAGSDGGARTVLGRSADGPLELDLARDGPHALVAGTTGAGKSELLRALVAGLAANHPPDEVNFLLIDYKGGAAFAECAELPHTAGLVTDLDPYLTERALRSLDSELRRRERLLAGVGAADLAGYRAAGPSAALPRLVIVVDEFAALVDELPEFVHGLVGVAQRGRSLGVHLVLATQRPGGAVSAEIRANTAVRIALRVTDPAESADVIDAPDAALLDRSTPGRAYLRCGPSLVAFQTGHGGALTCPDPGAVEVEALGPWRERPVADARAGGTDLSRLVTAVRAAAASAGRPAAQCPWRPPLPDRLPRTELGPPACASTVALARVDLPGEQRQPVLELDLARADSLLVAGAARSGRTGALLAAALGAAEQLPPGRLSAYVVDAGGPLRDAVRPLPHVATVLGPGELSLAARLFAALERESGRPDDAGGARRPFRLLLVDGWDRLQAGLPDLEAADCGDRLLQLLRVGPAAGLTVVVTGDRSVLTPRISSAFSRKVLLRMPDRSDFGLLGIATRDVPESLPPGRGLRADDGAVVQFTHAAEAPDAAAAHACALGIADRWRATGGAAPAADAVRIRPLPRQVRLAELPVTEGALTVGLAGDRLDRLALDPFAGAGRLLVAGPPRSGRSTTLCSLARQAHAAGVHTLVAAPARSPLVEAARTLGLPLIGPESETLPAPAGRTLLLVDDSEAFVDSAVGERLTACLRSADPAVAAVVAGRSDDLATTYRGVAAEVRRSHCGILLRPGPVDGELLGVRLPRRAGDGPPGRGIAVGEPSWGPPFETGEPVPIQVAAP